MFPSNVDRYSRSQASFPRAGASQSCDSRLYNMCSPVLVQAELGPLAALLPNFKVHVKPCHELHVLFCIPWLLQSCPSLQSPPQCLSARHPLCLQHSARPPCYSQLQASYHPCYFCTPAQLYHSHRHMWHLLVPYRHQQALFHRAASWQLPTPYFMPHMTHSPPCCFPVLAWQPPSSHQSSLTTSLQLPSNYLAPFLLHTNQT